jgi:ketosteroid isomerase-like protein
LPSFSQENIVTTPPPLNTEFDSAEIREAERLVVQALEDTDTTKRVYFYTEAATFVIPGIPVVEGRDVFLRRAKTTVPLTSVMTTPLVTEGDGRLAYVYGHVSWENGPDAPVGSERTTIRCLMVWRKEADGQWRIVREFLND